MRNPNIKNPKVGYRLKPRGQKFIDGSLFFECTKCHKYKLTEEFYGHTYRAYGVNSECKDCSYPGRKYKGMTPAEILKMIKREKK